jgi:hypothetical protein
MRSAAAGCAWSTGGSCSKHPEDRLLCAGGWEGTRQGDSEPEVVFGIPAVAIEDAA